MSSRFLRVVLALSAAAVAQQACPVSVSSSVPVPSVAPGFEARLVVSNLTEPRGIEFDRNGHLLVVQQNAGIVALTLNDDGGACLSERSRSVVVDNPAVSNGPKDGGRLD